MFTRVPGFGTIPIVRHSYGFYHTPLQFGVVTFSVDDSCWLKLGFIARNGAPRVRA